MTFVELKSVAEINPRYNATAPLGLDDLVSFIPMAAVSEKTRTVVAAESRPFKEVRKGYTYFEEGDVIVAKITPCFENGKLALAKDLPHQLAFGSTEFHVLRPSPMVECRYLYFLLQSPEVFLKGAAQMKGAAGQKRVPADFFKRLKIPLPAIEEQKRIADILDAADELRTKRRESIAQLDALLQSTFLDMFGDPVTNPKGWDVLNVGDVGDVQGGLQVSSKRRSLPVERPYLRVANVYRGSLKLDGIKMIQLTESEEQRTLLVNEDILIVEGHGNKDEIGRCARWDGSIDPCVHQNHLIRLRCDQSIVLPIFAEAYLNSESGRRELKGTSRTTSGLNTISVSKVKGAKMMTPPISLQKDFAAFKYDSEKLRQKYSTQLTELDTLFASLQSRAFRGEL